MITGRPLHQNRGISFGGKLTKLKHTFKGSSIKGLMMKSRDLVSKENPDNGTEYGGVGGLIQPPPHEPTPSERLMQLLQLDPLDTETEVDVE